MPFRLSACLGRAGVDKPSTANARRSSGQFGEGIPESRRGNGGEQIFYLTHARCWPPLCRSIVIDETASSGRDCVAPALLLCKQRNPRKINETFKANIYPRREGRKRSHWATAEPHVARRMECGEGAASSSRRAKTSGQRSPARLCGIAVGGECVQCASAQRATASSCPLFGLRSARAFGTVRLANLCRNEFSFSEPEATRIQHFRFLISVFSFHFIFDRLRR